MEIVIATNNVNKLTEVRDILEGSGHKLYSLDDVGAQLTLEENGKTFIDNALIKAKEACARSGLAALGDDSGLCVDALGGAPGVHSARFAGIHGDDKANNAKLMQLLERTPYAKRTARFVCALALVLPNGQALKVQGACEGMIGLVAGGECGFGYDPLFFVNGVSFAQMTPQEKNAVSHRSVALRKFKAKLPDFLAKQENTSGY